MPTGDSRLDSERRRRQAARLVPRSAATWPGRNSRACRCRARTDQAWRFSNVGALDLSPYVDGDTVVDEPTAAKSSNARPVSTKSRAGSFLPTIISCERDVAPGKTARSRRHLPAARAGDDRARRSVPPAFHEPAGHARFRQVRRAPRGLRQIGHFPLRAARRGGGTAARDLSLAARARTPRFSRTRSLSPTSFRR